ncbi:MAG: type B 50S ribosomal protein L31 [Bacteriovoracia bacterium]
MKKNIHPESKSVVFQDIVTGKGFLINSAIDTKETIRWTDGKTYPLVKVEISSDSHPAFTGAKPKEKKSSRMEEFEKKYAKRGILLH